MKKVFKRWSVPNFGIIPKKTGVYFFLNKNNKTLYVGKAVDIRNRIRSHFANSGTTHAAKANLLKETRNIRWELCETEPEALIREAELIKKLKPRYNVLLRDDKNYAFVGFTKEPFPKVFITHQPKEAKSYKLKAISYVGPFTDVGSLKQTLKFLRRAFPYCRCMTPHNRECLSGTLGRCLGACCLAPKSTKRKLRKAQTKKQEVETRKRYRKNIKAVEEILRGKRQRLLKTLKSSMQQSAKEQRFEEAAQLRDQVRALENVFSHASRIVKDGMHLPREREGAIRHLQRLLKLTTKPQRIEMYDMSNIHGKFAVGSMVVFHNGIPEKSGYRRFRIKTVRGISDIRMMQEVIARRLRHHEWLMPDVLAVDGGKAQIGAATSALKAISYKLEPIPILGLAKGKNELHYVFYKPGSYKLKAISSLPRSRLPRSLRHLLTHLQDEAHRFAITYHRKLRSRGFTS